MSHLTCCRDAACRLALAWWYLLCPLLAAGPLLVAQESKEQERAVAELRKVGATVKVDGKAPGSPVVAVSLSGCSIPLTEATLAQLKGLPHVRTLDL